MSIKNSSLYKTKNEKKTDKFITPDWLFKILNKKFKFTLDICASPKNTKCKKFFTIKEDALKQEWKGICWMNPPYGKKIIQWVKKAYETSLQGNTVVCLLPARTDTKWMHEYCSKGQIYFLRRRLIFGEYEKKIGGLDWISAPFPSMIVVFKKGLNPKIVFSKINIIKQKGTLGGI